MTEATWLTETTEAPEVTELMEAREAVELTAVRTTVATTETVVYVHENTLTSEVSGRNDSQRQQRRLK